MVAQAALVFCTVAKYFNSARTKSHISVIMSSDSPSLLQTTIPLVGYDVPDEARPGKISPTTPPPPPTPSPSPIGPVTIKLLNDDIADTEVIENDAVPMAQTDLPAPEPRPKIGRNGIDSDSKKKPVARANDDDSCVVDCIYFTQQCCECIIL
ncbi:uncharacterized protein LOC143375606 isoform X2 [Andrena cerasifolii]|uniref:uncharacterized protein LOC143375606 isoform X2 n=1 Tax=Andrena cerasifolii TaxID=2819439 RepID=UPI00403802A1